MQDKMTGARGLRTVTIHLRRPAVRLFGPSVEQYLVRGFIKTLETIGIETTLVHDDDWRPQILADVDAVFVPYAPVLSDNIAADLKAYVDRGGCLVLGIDPAPALRALLVEPDIDRVLTPADTNPLKPMMPTMIQQATASAPRGFPQQVKVLTRDYWKVRPKPQVQVWSTWPDGSPATLAAGSILWLSTANHEPTHYRYGQHIQFTRDREQLAAILLAFLHRGLPADAQRRLLAGMQSELDRWQASVPDQPRTAPDDPMDCHVQSIQARQAYERASRPVDAEVRLVNIGATFSVPDWPKLLDTLADANINLVISSLISAPYLQYCHEHDETLEFPVLDPLPAILEGCRERGIEFWPWVMTWSTAGPTMPQQMAAAGRMAIGDSVYEPDVPAWLCPSHPENLALNVRFIETFGRRLAGIGGFFFDFFRFPREDYCICAGCRQRFEQWLGEPVRQWPIPPEQAALRQRWHDWRRAVITGVATTLRDALRRTDPEMRLGAAVFPGWHLSHHQVGQDIRSFVQNDALDVLFPMDYAHRTDLLIEEVRHQKAVCQGHGTYLCPMIGPASFTADVTATEAVEQINAIHDIGTDGWGLFTQNYVVTLESFLPALKRGVCRRPAQLPWRTGPRPDLARPAITGAIPAPAKVIDWPFGTLDLSVYTETQTP